MLIFKLILILKVTASALECGYRNFGVSLVINGDAATSGQFPWSISMFNLSSYHCGGVMLDGKHILTGEWRILVVAAPYRSILVVTVPFECLFFLQNSLAAHCVTQLNVQDIRVHFGQHDLRESNGLVERRVTEAYIHDDFNRRPKNHDADIAVLRIDEPVTFTDKIQPVCLPRPRASVRELSGTVVGYGKSESRKPYVDIPRYIDAIKVTDLLSCYEADREFFNLLSRRTFCAGRKGKSPGRLWRRILRSRCCHQTVDGLWTGGGSTGRSECGFV
jgi:Trypsin